MAEDQRRQTVTLRLARLLATRSLDAKDKDIGERSLRRLSDPLRLMIFGPDTQYAVALLNLVLGTRLVPQPGSRAQIQIMHSEEVFADLYFRDGSRTRLPSDRLRDAFADNPSKVRIGADLPVLRKLSVMVVANSDAAALCEDIERAMFPSDIVLWTGDNLDPTMSDLWGRVPDELRSHSHIVFGPQNGETSSTWDEIAAEFVEAITVEPEAALTAKSGAEGIDKAAFKDAGGVALVKLVKSEIEMLTQSSQDAAEVLLMRHGDGDEVDVDMESAAIVEPSPPPQSAPPEPAPAPASRKAPASVPVSKPRPAAEPSQPARQAVVSRPVSKAASRPRSVTTSRVDDLPVSQTVSRTSAVKSQVKPKRVKTERLKSRTTVTPWSLGL